MRAPSLPRRLLGLFTEAAHDRVVHLVRFAHRQLERASVGLDPGLLDDFDLQDLGVATWGKGKGERGEGEGRGRRGFRACPRASVMPCDVSQIT